MVLWNKEQMTHDAGITNHGIELMIEHMLAAVPKAATPSAM
jgi:hypothetical protein